MDAAGEAAAAAERREMAERALAAEAAAVAHLRCTIAAAQVARSDDARRAAEVLHSCTCPPCTTSSIPNLEPFQVRLCCSF